MSPGLLSSTWKRRVTRVESLTAVALGLAPLEGVGEEGGGGPALAREKGGGGQQRGAGQGQDPGQGEEGPPQDQKGVAGGEIII